MLRFTTGNILESDAQTLTNTVNCVGVMGKGIALEFRKRFPEMHRDYVERTKKSHLVAGRPYLFKDSTPWILNFPTKRHWRGKARITDIEKGLTYLRDHYREWGIRSLALPPLGCGLGGLDWNNVRPLIERYLGDLNIEVIVYEPGPDGFEARRPARQPALATAELGASPKRAIEDSFPVVEISRLAQRMGSTNSPILETGKWFARRKAIVFRAILLGAMKSAQQAASGSELIIGELYRDHREDPDTNGLLIFDPFVGGGTGIVEALRLGCRVVASELNPVAWFVTKVATEPKDLRALDEAFASLARRPVSWSGKPLAGTLSEQYKTACECCGRRDAADIIYTFWVKSTICRCGRQVRLFADYVIAQKNPSIRYWENVTCPKCQKKFDWELDPAALVAEPHLMVNAPAYSAGTGRTTARWSFSSGPTVVCPWCEEQVQPTPAASRRPGRGARPSRKKVALAVLLCPECYVVWQHRGPLGEEARCPGCSHTYDPRAGNIPRRGWYLCRSCGHTERVIKSIERLPREQRLPTTAYAIEARCPSCARDADEEVSEETTLFGKRQKRSRPRKVSEHSCLLAKTGGRFFKRFSPEDQAAYQRACDLWQQYSDGLPYPTQPVPRGEKTKTHVLGHHYSYWHQMFNPRHLLCLSTLLAAICDEGNESAREALLCAFLSMLNNMSDYTSYIPGRDCTRQVFARHDYHPKLRPCEASVWGAPVGMGSFVRYWQKARDGFAFAQEPNDYGQDTGVHGSSRDPLRSAPQLLCRSATAVRLEKRCDLVVTDPPYGSNIQYAELADYFYVWLRLALRERYPCFAPESGCPKREEIVVNREQHKTLGDFRSMLTDAFRAAHTSVKDDGLLVFTFHHAEAETWEALLQAIMEAGFVLVAAYPVHGDAEHSLHIAGQQAIAYDLIHVCRKRESQAQAEQRSWAGIRQEIRRRAREEIRSIEAGRYGNEPLSPTDVNIILIGKCLELYSGHYGAVVDHEGNPVPLREALEDIRMMVDQLVTSDRPLPGELGDIDPESYVYLTCLCDRSEIKTDEVHKATRGILEPDALLEAGLIIKGRAKRGRTYEVKSPPERFPDLAAKFLTPQPSPQPDLFGDLPPEKTRGKVLFVDRIHFLIGLLEGGESLMPWLERWRGLWPQLRAACEYLTQRQRAFAGPLQKICDLMDVGPLFR